MSTPSFSLDQFIVNTNLSGSQYAPRVAALSDGRSVIVWTEGTTTGPDISGTAVRAQIVRADGTFEGPELLVNTFTTSVQDQADVTVLDNGGFVVTWRTSNPINGNGGDGNGSAIKAQVFDSAGGTVGAEFLVNVLPSGSQVLPSITALADGRFAVAWQGAGVVGGPLEDMGLRIFNADGTPSSGETNWTDGGLSAARQASITQLGNGNLLVSYLCTDANLSGIRARIFTSAGDLIPGSIDINTTTTGHQTLPDVVALTGGGFVVTWTDNSTLSADTSGNAVRAQVFTDVGVKVGAELLVNTKTTGNQGDSSVTALSDGRFLIAWTDQGNGSGNDIRAQLFNADGTPSGSELLVSATNTGNQAEASVQELSDGRIMVSWRDVDDVVAQFIDPREAAISYSGTVSADIAVGTRFRDVLNGLGGNDRLFGAAGRDTLFGGNGADLLDGGIEADLLRGGAGNDTLDGGRGADTLTGGTGVDWFVFSAPPGGTHADIITDFTPGTDRIVLTLSVFTGLGAAGNLPAGLFVAGTAPIDGGDRILHDVASGALFYDRDGTGAAAAFRFATVTPGLVLTASDFLIV